ncbi:alpha/beta hydrolase [Marinomonas sp. PE14-40]|uniref:alpha/beta hydrolase n=1 Tax=Marinomonas sp. PE14-40 TaxID=3060621 RepID=UPI003F67E3D3
MKNIITKLAGALTLSIGFSGALMAQSSPTLVFVHGAHFSGNSWAKVQQKLNSKVTNIAIDLPGRKDNISPDKVSLELSAASLCNSLDKIKGDKVIVSHSQGGAVTNASLGLCPSEEISKLIYVTSVAPLEGEAAFDMLSDLDGKNYFNGVVYDESSTLLNISDATKFADTFAPKANKNQLKWLKKHAISEPSVLAENKLSLDSDRYNTLEKYYVFAKQDQIISLSTQEVIANKLNLTRSFEIESGHLPMLTHADKLAMIIEEIVQ